jgi:hypothetical protein
MKKSVTLVPSIVSPEIRKLENEGWERVEETMSLEYMIMQGESEGVSFIAFFDDWFADKCELDFSEFYLNGPDNTKIHDHAPIIVETAKLHQFIQPFKDRAFDIEGFLSNLQNQVEQEFYDDLADQLKAS